MKTAEQFMQAVYSIKESLKQDTSVIEKNNDLVIATNHAIRRSLKQIKVVKEWYAYHCGKSDRPRVSIAGEFNPYEGPDKTNLYYLFKAMKSCMPWDLDKEILLQPTAITLLKLDFTEACFPSKEVITLKSVIQEFINRWTLPKYRADWTAKKEQYELDRYERDMDHLQEKLTDAYRDLSNYFARLENPDSDPVKKMVGQTYTNVKKISKKLGVKNEYTGKAAREKALKIWRQAQTDPRVLSLCASHRVSYANVFVVYKKEITALGYTTTSKFKSAVGNELKSR